MNQGLALLEHPEAVGAGGKHKQLLHLSMGVALATTRTTHPNRCAWL